MVKYITKNNKFVWYCLFVIIDAVNVAYMAVLLKLTMDAATSGEMQQLVHVINIIICFIIEYSLVSWGTRRLRAAYFSEIMYSIKKDLFSALIDKNTKTISEKKSAEYLSIFNNNLRLIEENGIAPIFTIIRSGVIFVLSLAIMMYIQPIVSIVAIALSILPILVPKIWGKRLNIVTEAYTKSMTEYNRVIDDIFMGIQVIRNYELEGYMTERHEKNNQMLKLARLKKDGEKAGADVTTNFIAVGMQFAVFAVAGVFVVLKKITAGDVLAITQLMNKVMNPIFDIIDSLNQMQSVKGIQDELLSYLNKEIQKDVEIKEKERRLEEIRFENVSFAYVPDLNAIMNFSFCFERGKKYAIVGESGSGKTTLLKLMGGELDDYDGTIWYNADNKKWGWQDLKKVLSIINQETYLFEGTIRENILFDKILDETRLEKIIKDVKLKETLEKKEVDMSYFLSGNGENLSGGEKEKIAIARALIRGKEWLLLDEATAGMDSETFLNIESMLIKLEGVTYINITHRLHEEILKMYDVILVMQQGILVEQGTFQQLLEHNGVFAKLFNAKGD